MGDLEQVLISPLAPLREAIALIDRSAIQIALVVDSQGVLIGTVTDGDIRRGLLRGLSIDSTVEQIMFREFRSLSESATDEEALLLMRRESLHHIPVLDEFGCVARLILMEEILSPQPLPNWVVVMAGGEGRRLLPLTENRPKPMLDVAGRPILELIVERCIEAGFERVIIAVGHLKHEIMEHFADGSRWGISIEYIEEERPLGTAGALSLLRAMPAHPLLVINGDVLTRVNMTELLRFHDIHEASATICVRPYETQVPYGVVKSHGVFMEAIVEKPTFTHDINAGMYVVGPEVLELLVRNERIDMPDLLGAAASLGHAVGVFPIHEFWLDVGHPETLARANMEWR